MLRSFHRLLWCRILRRHAAHLRTRTFGPELVLEARCGRCGIRLSHISLCIPGRSAVARRRPVITCETSS